MQELGKSESIADMLVEKIMRHQDIFDEFCAWLSHRDYSKCALEIEGYTPVAIHEINPKFNASGVFSFMVTLKENPERAKKYIAQGFIEK